jgi:hypothetical protein
MAVLSVPLRGAEVERVPLWGLWFWEVGARSVARELSVAIATGIPGEDNREGALSVIGTQLARSCRSSHEFRSDARKRHIFPTWEP